MALKAKEVMALAKMPGKLRVRVIKTCSNSSTGGMAFKGPDGKMLSAREGDVIEIGGNPVDKGLPLDMGWVEPVDDDVPLTGGTAGTIEEEHEIESRKAVAAAAPPKKKKSAD